MIVEKSEPLKSTWVKHTLMTLLALIAAVLGVPGLLAFSYIFFQWFAGGFDLGGFESGDWVLGVAATLLLIVAMVPFGIFLRYVSWRVAPTISLVVSGLSVGVIFFAYGALLSGEVGENDPEGRLLIQSIGLGCFLIVSLPPFLHWRRARLKAGAK